MMWRERAFTAFSPPRRPKNWGGRGLICGLHACMSLSRWKKSSFLFPLSPPFLSQMSRDKCNKCATTGECISQDCCHCFAFLCDTCAHSWCTCDVCHETICGRGECKCKCERNETVEQETERVETVAMMAMARLLAYEGSVTSLTC